jgi:hypothetical protein
MFTQLVLMLHAGAMQHLGKIKNPLSDAVERDLQAAQAMIDLLEMLRVKTKGNLRVEEQKMLDQLLQELRLNYIDEVGKEPAPGKKPETEEPAP